MRIQPIWKLLKWALGVAFVLVVLWRLSVPELSLYMRQSQTSDLKPITEFRNDTDKLQMEIKRLEGELQAIEFVLTRSQQEGSFRTLIQQAYVQKRGRMEELKSMRELVINSLKK